MTKRNQLIVLLISLLASSFSIYQLTYNVSRRSPMRYAYAIAIGLSACLILYLLYKNFIQRMNKGAINHADYAKLYELNNTEVTGELEFYFTLEDAKEVKFSILNQDLSENTVVKNELFKSGGHIVRFNTAELENGIYFYCLETNKQKTMKRMKVQHDKLTV
jgi:hypothetical protein